MSPTQPVQTTAAKNKPSVQELDVEIAELQEQYDDLKARLTGLKRRRAQIKATEASALKRALKADANADRICHRWSELGFDGEAYKQVAAEFGITLRHAYRLIERDYANSSDLPSLVRTKSNVAEQT